MDDHLPADLEDFARRFCGCANDRDAEAVKELVEAGYEFDSHLAPGTIYRGPAGFEAWLGDVDAAFSEMSFELVDVHAVGDRTAVMTVKGTGVERSGVPAEVSTSHAWTFHDGRLERSRSFAAPGAAEREARGR